MNTDHIVSTFLDFFTERGHRRITGSSLVTDPGDKVLFTSAGMHPLVPYLHGEPHPSGRRLVNLQRCLRTTDLEEVGDDTHLTVFQMLGSWSLGDYDHPQSLRWGYELLRDGFGLPPSHLYVTVFGGSSTVDRDRESERVWTEFGLPIEFNVEDNWWPNDNSTGLCGPDSEIFVWTGEGPPVGSPGTDSRWVEVWNHVSMRYHRLPDGTVRPLRVSNVDTGAGLERLVSVLQGRRSIYDTDLFQPWREVVPRLWHLDELSFRIVSDHLRSIFVLVGDGVRPGGTGRGYVLRRLVRRCLSILRQYGVESLVDYPDHLVEHTYDRFELPGDPRLVRELLTLEQQRFSQLLSRAETLVTRRVSQVGELGEPDYRYLHETHGIPRDVVEELVGTSR